MSYAIMPTFVGNNLGHRNLQLRSSRGLSGVGGVRTMGDTQGDLQTAVAMGLIDSSDAADLTTLNVSDAQVIALINGQIDFETLMMQLAQAQATASLPQPQYLSSGVTPSAPASATGATTQVNPAQAPSPPSGAVSATASGTQPSTGQSTAGSTLTYTATFNPVPAFVSASSVIAQLAAQLPSYRMSVVSSTVLQSGVTSNGSFQLTIFDSVGHAYLTDIKSTLDSLVNAATKNSLISSTVPVVISMGSTSSAAPGAVAAPPAAATATSATSWIESNWPLLLAGGLAAVIIGVVFEKRV